MHAVPGRCVACAKMSSGSCWIALALVRSHPLQHLIDMRDRRFRLNAMAESDYEPAIAAVRPHIIDGLIYAVITGLTFAWLWPAA